jgi:hypothetical protein
MGCVDMSAERLHQVKVCERAKNGFHNPRPQRKRFVVRRTRRERAGQARNGRAVAGRAPQRLRTAGHTAVQSRDGSARGRAWNDGGPRLRYRSRPAAMNMDRAVGGCCLHGLGMYGRGTGLFVGNPFRAFYHRPRRLGYGSAGRRAGLGHRDTSLTRPGRVCADTSPGFFILNASAIDSQCGNGSIAYSSIALSGTTKSRGRAVFIEKISSIS